MNYSIIKDIANKKKLLLKDLARNVDMTEAGFHSAIRNNTMKIETLEKIANVLQVSIKVFFEDENKAEGNSLENRVLNLEKRMTLVEQKLGE